MPPRLTRSTASLFSQPAKAPEVALFSALPELSKAHDPCIDAYLVAEFAAAGPLPGRCSARTVLCSPVLCLVTHVRVCNGRARVAPAETPARQPGRRHTPACRAGVSGAPKAQEPLC